MTQITNAMILKALPSVMTILDGKSKGRRPKFFCYPAVKFPGVKHEIAFVMNGRKNPKKFATSDKAHAFMVRELKKIQTKLKAKIAKEKKVAA